MSNYKTLHKELTKILAPIADHKGEVMYSPAEALRPNDVYLLGFNPGQGGPETSIQEHLTYSLKRTDNAWLDERWGKNPGESSPLQDRMWKLFEALGLDLRTTPASNLIFRTSPDMTKVDYHILSELCWPAGKRVTCSRLLAHTSPTTPITTYSIGVGQQRWMVFGLPSRLILAK